MQGADETLEIPAGESLDVEVTFLPDPYMEPSTAPIATVVFHSNDPKTGGIAELPVFGKRRGPGLEVFPPDQVYFGFVGEGGTVVRQVSLYNASMAPITGKRCGSKVTSSSSMERPGVRRCLRRFRRK